MSVLSGGHAVIDTTWIIPNRNWTIKDWVRCSEGERKVHMGGESGLLEGERNPKSEPLKDDGKRGSMGAKGAPWDGEIPQPESWEQASDQGKGKES
jgi:hypothetical protein